MTELTLLCLSIEQRKDLPSAGEGLADAVAEALGRRAGDVVREMARRLEELEADAAATAHFDKVDPKLQELADEASSLADEASDLVRKVERYITEQRKAHGKAVAS